jgi:transcriptional regulator with XRE-family HTH domain
MQELIKNARKKKGISQAEMAAILGIGLNTYRRKEENPRRFTVEQAQKIAETTGCEMQTLFS